MKKTITSILTGLAFIVNAQTVETFESFTLAPSSFYKDTNSVAFTTSNATFRHVWTNGSFAYWSGGFSYTNLKDSSNGNFSNLYNCRALNGYNNSNLYVTGQNNGIIKLNSPNNVVDGFYFTNTTYAYKSMKFGDSFAKKFGGTSGNDPDYFRVIVKGYKNGVVNPDTAVFYLADYRFTNNASDYIVEGWQYVNTSNIGQVDSIKFVMQSSDVGSFGINTPLFFSLDNFTTSQSFVGINEISKTLNVEVYPNPTNGILNIKNNSDSKITATIYNQLGQQLNSLELKSNNNQINFNNFNKGIYFINLTDEKNTITKKIILN